MRNTLAVFCKQWLDSSTVKSIVVQVLFYPAILLLFSFGDSFREESTHLAVLSAIAPVFIGSSPMLTVNSLIRDDKYSGALRALLLASVRPKEYMTGICLFMLVISAITSVLIGLTGGLPLQALPLFILAMTLAALLTVLLGCAASLKGANISNAAVLLSVFSLVNGMLPILETVYPAIHVITRFWYTQQIKDIIVNLCAGHTESLLLAFCIIGMNLLLILVALFFIYRKSRLFEN